jgi:signal transduction histidine kinase
MLSSVDAMTTPVPSPSWLGRIARRAAVDTEYLIVGLPVAVFSFSFLLALFIAGTVTSAFVFGLPLLALALLVARGFADIERLRLGRLQGAPVPRPRYRPADPDAGWVRRTLAPIRQGQAWLDLLHGLFALVPSLIGFVLGVTWWALAVGGLSYPIWYRYLPQDDEDNPVVKAVLGSDTTENRLLFYVGVGVIALITLPMVLRGAAALHAGYSRALLTSLAQLQGRIEDLTESRAAVVSAEATALRRLERDIHDGPQQRLVRLAMDLSRAQRQLDRDPAAARQTLTEAVGQTRETLDELRALSRGIAPPILADRGLSSALAALASRSIIPVELAITVEDRLPAVVENTVYFVAAEALANVAKHSGATTAKVTVRRQDGAIYLVVEDDGVGGAHLAKGHGLAGLADRVRAVDGQLAVDSPDGGPTVLVAEVPCGS